MLPKSPHLFLVVLCLLNPTSQTCIVSDQCHCTQASPNIWQLDCPSDTTETLTAVPNFNSSTYPFDSINLYLRVPLVPNNTFHTASGGVLNTTRVYISVTGGPTQVAAGALAGLNHIEQLIIETESLSSFPAAALQGLNHLTFLRITGSKDKSLPINALSSLTALTALSLKYSQLQTLVPSDLATQQGSLLVLNLTVNKFTEIPAAVKGLQQLQELRLRENNILTIKSGTFSGMTKLILLDLSQNGLRTIEPNAFDGLQNSLLHLSLSKNYLAESNLQSLKSLQALQDLDISGNKLQSLGSDLFQGMQNLQKLLAQDNNITSLGPLAMGALGPSLLLLMLDNNKISQIGKGTFQALSNLQRLCISQQPIPYESTGGKIFLGLEDTLTEIDLRNTSFKTSSWPAISSLRNLQKLNLANNLITAIPNDTFILLNSLDTLDLRYNNISSLQQRQLRGLEQSLTQLYLIGNSISTIDQCVFKDYASFNLNSSSSLFIGNNPLLCDCQVEWLRNNTANMRALDKSLIDWTCYNPPSLRGRLLSDSKLGELTCDSPQDSQVCDSYIVSTTATPAGTTVSIISMNATTDTILVQWIVRPVPAPVVLQLTNVVTENMEQELNYTSDVTNDTLEGLASGVPYTVCLTAYQEVPSTPGCRNAVTTKITPVVDSKTAGSKLQIILGCVLGALVLIIVVVSFILCCACCRPTYEAPAPPTKTTTLSRNDVPSLGNNTKRYSRSVNSLHSIDRLSVGNTLDNHGLTQEERTRIFRLLASSQASLNERYSGEPQANNSRVSRQLSTYSGQYEEIPADQLDEVQYESIDEMAERPKSAIPLLNRGKLPRTHSEGDEDSS